MYEIFYRAKFITFFAGSSCLLLDDSPGKISRELWWMNQKISPINIIPPWFSMLIYHLEMNNRPVLL
jgi:hypothetical protein